VIASCVLCDRTVSSQIDEYFDQRVRALVRVRGQIWAGCSRSVVCWDAKVYTRVRCVAGVECATDASSQTLDPCQMLQNHAEQVSCLLSVGREFVWTVSELDKRICVWRLGREPRRPSTTTLTTSAGSVF
jgi:hypothetical protein